MTFSEYAARWEEQILPLKKPSTIVTMRSHIRRAKVNLGHLPLDMFNESLIQEHITHAIKDLSPKGCKNYWSTLRLIFKQAKKEGLIAAIPSPELPKVTKKQQRWFTVDKMRAIIKAAPEEDKAMWTLFAETGMRAGEVFGLRCSDINFERDTICISYSVFNGELQSPKTESAVRTVCISRNLKTLLFDKAAWGGKPIFRTKNNTYLSQSAVLTSKLYPLLDSLGIPRTGFHAFRRGNGSLCASLGMPLNIISRRLGHAMQNLTLDKYAMSATMDDLDWSERIGKALE